MILNFALLIANILLLIITVVVIKIYKDSGSKFASVLSILLIIFDIVCLVLLWLSLIW